MPNEYKWLIKATANKTLRHKIQVITADSQIQCTNHFSSTCKQNTEKIAHQKEFSSNLGILKKQEKIAQQQKLKSNLPTRN